MNENKKQRIARPGSPRRRKTEPRISPAQEVPPLRPAALEPVWSKGKLILPPGTAECDSGSVVLVMALKLLRSEIASLAASADFDGTLDQRALACLWSVAGRIPVYAPAQDELFYLAHLKEFLEVYAKTANNEWPAVFAERFNAVIHHFDCTVRRFPKWRDFAGNAENDPLTSGDAAKISALAQMMAAALREDEARRVIDLAIPSALEVFQAPLRSEIMRPGQQFAGPGEACKLLLANDLLESIDNIAKRTAEAALEIKNSGREAGKPGLPGEALLPAEEDGGLAYIWMTRTLLKLIASTSAPALHSKFFWLKPILCLIDP